MEVFIITPFPNTINVLIENNIANQGIKKNLLNVEVVNLRDFTNDNYKPVKKILNGNIHALNQHKWKQQYLNYKNHY